MRWLEFFSRLFFFFFWGILYPEQKWAKKCQRFPKSLWVSSTDADHLQPCVHAGTISACMRFRAKPSWTNPIKPFSLAGCGRDTVFTAASAGTVKTPTPYKALCGQFGLLFKLQSVYFISPNDKPIRTASVNRLFIIYCSLTYAAVNTHQLFYGLGFCLIGWEIDSIFGRTFKLFRCKSQSLWVKEKIFWMIPWDVWPTYFVGYCDFEAKIQARSPCRRRVSLFRKGAQFLAARCDVWWAVSVFVGLTKSLLTLYFFHGLEVEKLLSHWPRCAFIL